MRILTKLVLIFLIFISCDENEKIDLDLTMFEYTINGYTKTSSIKGKLYPDNSIVLESEELFMYVESMELDSFGLGKDNFSEIIYKLGVNRFSSNTKNNEIDENYIKITDIDLEKMEISGVFESVLRSSYEDGRSYKLNGGEFFKVKLEEEEEYEWEGRVSAEIEGEKIKYRYVKVRENSEFLRITISHSLRHSILIEIPKDIEEGMHRLYGMSEQDPINKDKVTILFSRSFEHPYTDPDETSEVFIESKTAKYMKGNLKAEIKGLDDSVVVINNFEFELYWN